MSYLILSLAFAAAAQATTFQSPNGVTEECRVLPHLAAGKYDIDDSEDEVQLCEIDFYAQNKVALCPKTWSTSPGTMIYDISNTNLSQRAYEAQPSCGGALKGHTKLSKFKQTMNAHGTSGTYAPAGLLYYHFSRYFDTNVKVPVAVVRTMDRQAHFERVTKKAHTKNMGKSRQNKAGWAALYNAEINPSSYTPTDNVFTADRKQIWGFMGDMGGERYGPEFNGIRSAWGEAQNYDFQETPAFLALRSEKPLEQAIAEGLERGMAVKAIKEAMGPTPSKFQMAVWMRELSEIVTLDFIFSQQDRVGNIDFRWYVYHLDERGKVKSEKLKGEERPHASMQEIDYPLKNQPGVELVQRTRLPDNDAGGRQAYVNYTKTTKMLEKLRHFSPDIYKKLIHLNHDFTAHGEVYDYLRSQFGLTEAEVQQVVNNTRLAAEILSQTCRDGKLRFDLASVKTQFKGGTEPVTLNCDNP